MAAIDDQVRSFECIARRAVHTLRVPPHLREDAEAAALVGIWKAIVAHDPERGMNLRAYAFWRAVGEVRDELRRQDIVSRTWREQGRPIPHLEREWVGGTPIEEGLVCPRPRADAVASAKDVCRFLINACTKEARPILQMRLQGLPDSEIARRLGISYHTVYKRMRLLREWLEERPTTKAYLP